MRNSDTTEKVIASVDIESSDPAITSDNLTVSRHELRQRQVQAWATLIGAALSLFSTYGQLLAFGTYQLYYQQHQLQSSSPSTISWIGSIQIFLSLFLGTISGRLCDRYGPKSQIAVGCCLCTISLIILSFATKLYQFVITQGLLFGTGTGIQYTPCIKCVSTHFRKHRASGIGIAMLGSAVGGATFPLIISSLFERVGFAWTMRIGGFLCLVCGILAYLTVTVANDYDGGENHDNFFDLSPFKDAKYLAFCFGVSMACLGFYVPPYYLAAYTKIQLHTSSPTAISVISVLNALSGVGRILPTIAADYAGRFNLTSITAIMSGVACFTVWLGVPSYGGAIGFAAFYGFFSGAFVPLTPACVVDLSEEPMKKKNLGARIGLCYVFVSIPSLVGEPLAGAILDAMHGNYEGCIMYAGASLVLGGVVIGIVRFWHGKGFKV